MGRHYKTKPIFFFFFLYENDFTYSKRYHARGL